ncbi:MAG TPA: hypothetical protein PLZ12_12900 [Saprospiraceae bacterium]|nr:hypothetical protein [Saprospiraceae bacterium]
MKKHFFIIPAFLLTSLFAFAQSIPQGINYQAVARDSKGAPLALQNIGLRVSLRAGDAGGKAAYEEVHLLKTNELGMFQLVIGQGRTERGDFRQVPWSEHPIWMVLALDETGKGDFVTLAATQLMAVPYAFHAGTAETWSAPMTELEKNRRCSPTGIPYWTNLGNYNVNDTCHFIGTTVPVDFIFKTNNVERMRITKNGELLIVARTNFQDNVQFSGDSVIVDNDLFVGGNADVGINLSIGNDVHIGNDLQVDSNVQINNYLQVEGPSWLNNRVIVDAYIQGSQSSQDSYPLLIRGSGQGLAIQVDPSNFSPLASGRGNNYISFWNSSATMTGRVEGMSKADLDPTGLLSIVSSIITTPPSTLNMNPASILQLPTLNLFAGSAITGIDFSALSFSSNPFVTDGNLIFNTGAFNPGDFNALINSSLSSPSASFLNIYNGRDLNGTPASILWHVIQNIVCDTTTGLFPLIVGDPEAATNFKSQIFSDYSMDILQGGISTLGSLIQFAASFASPLDPEDVLSTAIGAAVEITNMVIYGSYADINLGVAYESGSGDYAEWLERANTEEIMHPGDVVGVIGGKVSKQFANPERFMVVSTSPIVLGNMPTDKNREKDHEKIAFMGQVPVKVKGPVKTGDYILPSGENDGMAIAVSPKNMKVRDYRRIVGVAWSDAHPDRYINYINTAVGLNQNDFAHVLDEMQTQMNAMQLAIAEVNPNFKPRLYDTGGSMVGAVQERDYSVSPTHKEVLFAGVSSKQYTSQREMLDDARTILKDKSGLDINKIALLDHLFTHPEQASAMGAYYENMKRQFEAVHAGIAKELETK